MKTRPPVPPPFTPPEFSYGPSLLDIACGSCGAQADFLEWITDRFGFDRPRDEFQCPNCGHAFRLVHTREAWKRNEVLPITPTL